MRRNIAIQLVVVQLVLQGASGVCPAVQEALENLTAGVNYNKDVRPGVDGPPVEVGLQVYVNSIVAINQQQQSITIDGYFRQYWVDSRLAGLIPGSCSSVELPERYWNHVWRPDIFFENSVKETYGMGRIGIATGGVMSFSERITHTLTCHMDFSRLPFDTQTCRISMASYGRSVEELIAVPASSVTPLVFNEKNLLTTQWAILNDEAQWSSETRVFGGDVLWAYTNLDLPLKRLPMSYFLRALLPTILFITVSWSGLWISRKVAPARVAMSVIPVLINLNLVNSVYAGLPTLSNWTWLTAFLSISMLFCTISIFEFGVVSYLLHLEDVVRPQRWQAFQAIVAKALKLQAEESDHEAKRMAIMEEAGSPSTIADIDKIPLQGMDEYMASLIAVEEKPTQDRWALDSEAAVLEHKAVLDRKRSRGSVTDLTGAEDVVQYLFMKFDTTHSGQISPPDLRKALRQYGHFFSLQQVEELFRNVGALEGSMDIKHFEVMALNFKKYAPAQHLQVAYEDLPPSLRVDIATRWAFAISYSLVILSFLVALFI